MLECSAITTSSDTTDYRYSVWIEDEAYIVFLENGFPLRWYVDIELPFRTAASPAIGLLAKSDAAG